MVEARTVWLRAFFRECQGLPTVLLHSGINSSARVGAGFRVGYWVWALALFRSAGKESLRREGDVQV